MSLRFYAPLNQVKTSQWVQKLEGMVLRQADRSEKQKAWDHISHVSFRLKSVPCRRKAGGARAHLSGMGWDGMGWPSVAGT